MKCTHSDTATHFDVQLTTNVQYVHIKGTCHCQLDMQKFALSILTSYLRSCVNINPLFKTGLKSSEDYKWQMASDLNSRQLFTGCRLCLVAKIRYSVQVGNIKLSWANRPLFDNCRRAVSQAVQ